jgi:hypothetical protein
MIDWANMEWKDVTNEPYDEKHFLEDLTRRHWVLGNALARTGFTLQKLRELAPTDIPRGNVMTRVVFTHPSGSRYWHDSHRWLLDSPGQLRWDSWDELFDIPGISYVWLLRLVNYLRGNGVELPWFAKWDEYSANWTALKGRYREPPVTEEVPQ